jgi:hypothetical protein
MFSWLWREDMGERVGCCGAVAVVAIIALDADEEDNGGLVKWLMRGLLLYVFNRFMYVIDTVVRVDITVFI